MKRPGSVLFYGMAFTVAGAWCLVWGLGRIGAEDGSHLVGWLATLVGALSLYAGPGLYLGENAARCLGQWIAAVHLAYVVLVASRAVLGLVHPGLEPLHLGVVGVVGLLVRLVLCMGALWALAGPEALAFTGGGHEPEHDAHHDPGPGSVHA